MHHLLRSQLGFFKDKPTLDYLTIDSSIKLASKYYAPNPFGLSSLTLKQTTFAYIHQPTPAYTSLYSFLLVFCCTAVDSPLTLHHPQSFGIPTNQYTLMQGLKCCRRPIFGCIVSILLQNDQPSLINTSIFSVLCVPQRKRFFFRRSGDPIMATSSIALLQERFRQLQKVRQKREAKELLKLFSEPDRAGSTKRYAPEVDFPNRQPQQDSLTLGLNSLSRKTDFRATGIPASTSLWTNSAPTSSSTSKYLENPDVDTSLHLQIGKP